MKPKFFLILIFIAVLLICAVFSPQILALYYQIEGGKLLDQVLRAAYPDQSDAIPCTLEPLKDTIWRDQVAVAISYLEKALRHNPSLAQAALLAGRGYCILGEVDKAVMLYGIYTHLQPKNPNGYLELSFAQSLNKFNTESIRDNLALARVDNQDLQTAAKDAFFAGKYQQSRVLYSLSNQLTSLTRDEEFLWALTRIIYTPTSIPDQNLIPTHQLFGSIVIEAEDLLWVNKNIIGKPLSAYPTGNSSLGVMWWNGTAVAVICVTHPGTYHFLIRAQNTSPGPVNLDLEWNFNSIAKFSLSKEDNSLEILEQDYYLSEGYQIIGLRFLNDAIVNGKNRNAFIDWLEIEAVSENGY